MPTNCSIDVENNQQTHVRFDPFATITDEPRNNHNRNTMLGNQTKFQFEWNGTRYTTCTRSSMWLLLNIVAEAHAVSA